MCKDLNLSYLLWFCADVGFGRVAVRAHHHDSHLEAGFSGSHSERHLLTRVGAPTAPLQSRLKSSNCLLGYGVTEEEAQYLVGLLSGYVHCVADGFSTRTDAVNSDTSFRPPGHGGRQGKRGGILGPSSHHQSSAANLRGQQLLACHRKPEDSWSRRCLKVLLSQV